jgi:hypothetical protein
MRARSRCPCNARPVTVRSISVRGGGGEEEVGGAVIVETEEVVAEPGWYARGVSFSRWDGLASVMMMLSKVQLGFRVLGEGIDHRWLKGGRGGGGD